MTLKMYYNDPEIALAKVEVVGSGQDEKGQYILTNQTIFYPEGGGQPADTGSIGGAAVLDVQSFQKEIRH